MLPIRTEAANADRMRESKKKEEEYDAVSVEAPSSSEWGADSGAEGKEQREDGDPKTENRQGGREQEHRSAQRRTREAEKCAKLSALLAHRVLAEHILHHDLVMVIQDHLEVLPLQTPAHTGTHTRTNVETHMRRANV